MISKILEPVLNIFRFHKFKAFILGVFYIGFLYFLFPYNDLGDVVSTKVSQLTQGQVFVDFQKLDISLIPQPGLELTDVDVQTAFTPELTAKTISVAPSISGLLSFKPGVSIEADGFLGGSLSLTTRGGDKTAAGVRRQKVDLDFSDLSVTELSKLADLPIKMEGTLSGQVDTLLDPTLVEQPAGDVHIQVARMLIPEGNVMTPMGPIGLPKMNLNDVVIDASADKGSLDLSRVNFGKAGSDLSGDITGHTELRLQRLGTAFYPVSGAYDFSIHLQVSDAARQKLGPYLSFLQPYQSGPNGYAFRASGSGPEAPPNLTRLQ